MAFIITMIFSACCILFQSSYIELGYALSVCPADADEDWTYRGRNGPMYWGENYPTCYGRSQSPVEINRNAVVKDENLEKLSLENYDVPLSSATIENNGHTIQVTPNDDVVRSINVKGSTYTLRQFHFHWGTNYRRGSEHVLDGTQYSMELHFVHMNENDEIAVVGVIFQESFSGNAELQKIVDILPQVRYKDSETELNTELNLKDLVPEYPASYYRYNGSLTTPDCSEGVTWSVLTDLKKVGILQMLQFRLLYSTTQENTLLTCTLSNNYRPLQPLNGRKIYLSQ